MKVDIFNTDRKYDGKRYQKNILIISKNFIPNLPNKAYLIKFLTINCLLKNTDNRNAFGIFCEMVLAVLTKCVIIYKKELFRNENCDY